MARTVTLQQIRNNVRAHLDVDTEELPDDLIDLYAQEGYDRIVRAELRWPFFQSDGSSPYPSTSGQAYISTAFSSVVDVRCDQWTLKYIDFHEATRVWPQDFTGTGNPPTHWSWRNGDFVFLFPTPGGIYNIYIDGYREPRDWIEDGAGAAPDGPAEFGQLVQTWVFSCAYLQVGDYELGQMYEARFDKGVAQLHARFVQAQPVPLTLNGDRSRNYDLPPRLAYPWEPRV